MERLQEALSRARDRRNESSSDAQTTPQSGPAKPQPQQQGVASAGDPAALWQSLPQYVPDERLLRANRVVAYFGGPEASAIDMMRTKLIQQMKNNSWRRLVVTSPGPACGKTTIIANLAFSLARHTAMRTLVIDTDMRRAELAKLLGIRANHSFSQVLTGDEPAEAHMIAYGNNLAFATNSGPSPNSSELLQSASARDKIAEVERRFEPDIVLFDAAPMLPSDDTVGFLDFVDAALLVAAAEQTSINEVDVVESEIASATNVLGVVLNKSRYAQTTYGYDGTGYY